MPHTSIDPALFRPRAWWRNCHLQTISRGLMVNRTRTPWEPVHLATDYGDHLKLDILPAASKRPRARALILHGLTGCSNAPPTPRVSEILSRHHVECWALNLRGVDRKAPQVPRLYHAGCSEDLEAIFSQIPQDLPWSFVGLSMGGNLLLKWLGENPKRQILGAKALVISCPYDLADVSNNLERTFINRLYRAFLIHRLKTIVKPFSKRYPEVLSRQTIDKCRSFPDFDHHITGPLHGFDGSDDYWSRCSSTQFLSRITIPTTLMHAKDDPFQPLPPTWVKNPHLTWELHSHGGHLGFIEKWGRDWMAQRIVDFVLG